MSKFYKTGLTLAFLLLQLFANGSRSASVPSVEIKGLSDADFVKLLALLTENLVSNREELTALKSTLDRLEGRLQVVESNLDDVKTGLQTVRSTAVTNLRMGSAERIMTWNDKGWTDEYGYVITEVFNFNTDPYIDYTSRRKIELQVNGTWKSIA